ncbi:MAG: DUF4129 domain-containing protein [Anaerolineaceae bacterium]|nr:DUF4129 domain-containing protein [Anaerolineaceae bacterium]
MNVLSLPPILDPQASLFRPWRDLTLGALMAMEMCWIATWFTDLSQTGKPVAFWRVYLVLGMMMILAHSLGRLLNTVQIHRITRQGFYLGSVLSSLWIGLQALLYWPRVLSPTATLQRMVGSFQALNTIPAEFWVILAMLLVWSRGLALAGRTLGVEVVSASFQLGVLMFFLYGAFLPLLPFKEVLWAEFAFLTLGLVAMSTGRIYQASRSRGARITRVNRGWILAIFGVALGVVSLGILPAALLPPQVADFLGRYLLLGLALFGGFMLLLVSPVIIVLLMLIPLLQRLWHGVSLVLGWQNLGILLKPLDLPRSVESMVQEIAVAKPVTLWAILILVTLLLLGGLSFRIWAERGVEVEEGESTLRGGDLLRFLRARLRRRFRKGALDLRGRLRMSQAEQMLAAARVRYLYGRMMRECARLGCARLPAVTPLEFIPELDRLFELPDETQALTQAYVRVRYGEAIETAAELASLNVEWDKIQRKARTLNR